MTSQPSLLDPSLHSARLKADPRLAEAKRLLREVLEDYTKEIDGVRPARPELVEEYKKTLDRLAVARGGATYFPYLSSGLGEDRLSSWPMAV